MKHFLLIFCLFWVAFPGEALAQEVEADSVVRSVPYRNSVYGELGGNALIGSLNYERWLGNQVAGRVIGLRAGVLFFPNGSYSNSYSSRTEFVYLIPLEVIFPLPGALHFGKQTWQAEWALGGTLFGSIVASKVKNSGSLYTETGIGFIPTLRVGWRYQPAGKAYFFKASITGFVIAVIEDFINVPPIIPWPSAGFGYTFGK